MADNSPVHVDVTLSPDYWRCCFDRDDQVWPADNCLPNNVAVDYVVSNIHLKQKFNNRTVSARANINIDTYYVDVYIKEEQNTEWIKHTHEVKWAWAGGPVMRGGRVKSGERTATINCKNALNGRYKCNKKQKYYVALHIYVIRQGVGQVQTKPQSHHSTYINDYRWCSDFFMLIDASMELNGTIDANLDDWGFCKQCYSRFTLGPKCTPESEIPPPYGCGPLYTDVTRPPDDWSNPAFSGTMGPKGKRIGGIGPPDSLMNAIVMDGNPTMPYVDVAQTGPTAGFGANYWEGTEYTLAPYGSGVLISGVFHPSGATGNPTGCAACTGTGSPSVPPTGSGCGTVTYTYDTGVVAWTETSMSDACAGANCQAPMAPWPSAAHGTVKSTGCDPLY